MNFDFQVKSTQHNRVICQKASRKLKAFVRLVSYMSMTKRPTSINAFFLSAISTAYNSNSFQLKFLKVSKILIFLKSGLDLVLLKAACFIFSSTHK